MKLCGEQLARKAQELLHDFAAAHVMTAATVPPTDLNEQPVKWWPP